LGLLEGSAPGIVGSSSPKRVKLDTVWPVRRQLSKLIHIRGNGLPARHGSWNGVSPSSGASRAEKRGSGKRPGPPGCKPEPADRITPAAREPEERRT